MQFLNWLTKCNILKPFQLASNLEYIKFRYSPGNSFDEHGIGIRIKCVERCPININLRAHIDIDSLVIKWHSLIGMPSYILQLLELLVTFVADKAKLILKILQMYYILLN